VLTRLILLVDFIFLNANSISNLYHMKIDLLNLRGEVLQYVCSYT